MSADLTPMSASVPGFGSSHNFAQFDAMSEVGQTGLFRAAKFVIEDFERELVGRWSFPGLAPGASAFESLGSRGLMPRPPFASSSPTFCLRPAYVLPTVRQGRICGSAIG